MFALSNDQTRFKNDFQKMKDHLESIKMILRCGICCSTLRDPIMTTCNHAFCRVCLFECFKRLPLMRCPVCNMTLNRRSCASCPLLLSLLEKYLLLAKAFKKDILTTDFAKENDFMESQIPMTQVVSLPLNFPQNQSPKKKSRCAKRHIENLQHGSVKLQKINSTDYSSSAAKTAVNTFAEASTFNHNSCGNKRVSATDALFKQLQGNSEEFSSGVKKIQNVEIQTDEKEMQHRSQQIDMEHLLCSPLYTGELNLDASRKHDEKIQKKNNANKTDALAQIEAAVNSVLEESKNETRIEVLIKCMPWIPGFLCLDREKLITAVGAVTVEEECHNAYTSSINGVDLVLESDEEEKIEIPKNTCRTIDCSHSKDQNNEQNTVLFPRDEQCLKKDKEVCHVMMVSGASKLSDQSLLREFLDNFSSFKLSTSINRKCTYLVIFNTDSLICEFWTVKLIYALVNHCMIISYSWLENCLKQKSVLPTHDFEILLKIDGTSISVTAQRAITDPSTLFDGHKFYVPQTFFNTKLVARDVFLEIVELSGGKTVSHVWELSSERSYIIFAPDCFNQDAARRFELDTKKEVVKADWIFASIGQHRILGREPYRLIHSIN